MATGPEHYQESENLAEQAARAADKGAEGVARLLIGLAQVHATLALAAATAGLDAHEGPGGGSATGRTAVDGYAWDAVTYREMSSQ